MGGVPSTWRSAVPALLGAAVAVAAAVAVLAAGAGPVAAAAVVLAGLVLTAFLVVQLRSLAADRAATVAASGAEVAVVQRRLAELTVEMAELSREIGTMRSVLDAAARSAPTAFVEQVEVTCLVGATAAGDAVMETRHTTAIGYVPYRAVRLIAPPGSPVTAGPVVGGPAPDGPVTTARVTSPATAGPVTAGPVTASPVVGGPAPDGPVTTARVTSPAPAGPVTAGAVTTGRTPRPDVEADDADLAVAVLPLGDGSANRVAVVFLPGLSGRSLRWHTRYAVPGLWDELRATGEQTLRYPVHRGVPDGTATPVSRLTMTLLFPAQMTKVDVTERNGHGWSRAETTVLDQTRITWIEEAPDPTTYEWDVVADPGTH